MAFCNMCKIQTMKNWSSKLTLFSRTMSQQHTHWGAKAGNRMHTTP